MTVENNHRWPTPNHNYVPEFQMSGVPHIKTVTLPKSGDIVFATAATWENCVISFDQVTRWIDIINHQTAGRHIRIYFNETAFKKAKDETPDSHYYKLDGAMQTNRLELKCKKIWIYPEYDNAAGTQISVVAGLTNVPSNTFPDQTRANGFTGVED